MSRLGGVGAGSGYDGSSVGKQGAGRNADALVDIILSLDQIGKFQIAGIAAVAIGSLALVSADIQVDLGIVGNFDHFVELDSDMDIFAGHISGVARRAGESEGSDRGRGGPRVEDSLGRRPGPRACRRPPGNRGGQQCDGKYGKGYAAGFTHLEQFRYRELPGVGELQCLPSAPGQARCGIGV